MAAGRSGYDGKHNNAGTYEVSGSFVVNGASAPATKRGSRFTVGAPTTGVYTIQLTDRFKDVIALLAHLTNGGVDSAKRAEVRAVDLDAGTVTVATQSAAGTDANLSSDEEVHFAFKFRNTLVNR